MSDDQSTSNRIFVRAEKLLTESDIDPKTLQYLRRVQECTTGMEDLRFESDGSDDEIEEPINPFETTEDDEDDGQEWEEVEEDEQDGSVAPTKSLFSDVILGSARDAIEHDNKTMGFDLLAFRAQHRLEIYECIQIVNFIRSLSSDELQHFKNESGRFSLDIQKPVWQDEKFLIPVIEEDPLISLFVELDDE
eukprot:TRINITY_DN8803_c0_g1_i3.p1 TRINITY_DN8803_c0_g1~~TRINITY_DN8803_c0_g1_i3.p1  ORF type:complete len:192 (+),score=66.65 TRINITY_DN8803_c0_g1_i3:54-629(+)